MNVQVTESGTWRRTLEIEAPAEDVDKRLNDAYRKYSKTLNLPGFRKGKIPLSVVKQQFGPAIQGEVVQEMVEEFYREASEAEGIQPVSQASIDDINFEEGQPLVFKASVDVRPEITVETYKGLKVTRPVFAVEDEHVEGRLRYMQEESATEQVVERAADLDRDHRRRDRGVHALDGDRDAVEPSSGSASTKKTKSTSSDRVSMFIGWFLLCDRYWRWGPAAGMGGPARRLPARPAARSSSGRAGAGVTPSPPASRAGWRPGLPPPGPCRVSRTP